ncbi:RAS guanyl-releasing protein 1 [Smittium mucronatum]|uniref:RAS guanyl-releasing protein 1 n=1 Tax=Smittium mucronatum TaxID=133383 RepID=A0A1R0H8H7_9FUNG|nr:RAS guanyl-releasing protein 1 [Smittium mucronatum]
MQKYPHPSKDPPLSPVFDSDAIPSLIDSLNSFKLISNIDLTANVIDDTLNSHGLFKRKKILQLYNDPLNQKIEPNSTAQSFENTKKSYNIGVVNSFDSKPVLGCHSGYETPVQLKNPISKRVHIAATDPGTDTISIDKSTLDLLHNHSQSIESNPNYTPLPEFVNSYSPIGSRSIDSPVSPQNIAIDTNSTFVNNSYIPHHLPPSKTLPSLPSSYIHSPTLLSPDLNNVNGGDTLLDSDNHNYDYNSSISKHKLSKNYPKLENSHSTSSKTPLSISSNPYSKKHSFITANSNIETEFSQHLFKTKSESIVTSPNSSKPTGFVTDYIPSTKISTENHLDSRKFDHSSLLPSKNDALISNSASPNTTSPYLKEKLSPSNNVSNFTPIRTTENAATLPIECIIFAIDIIDINSIFALSDFLKLKTDTKIFVTFIKDSLNSILEQQKENLPNIVECNRLVDIIKSNPSHNISVCESGINGFSNAFPKLLARMSKAVIFSRSVSMPAYNENTKRQSSPPENTNTIEMSKSTSLPLSLRPNRQSKNHPKSIDKRHTGKSFNSPMQSPKAFGDFPSKKTKSPKQKNENWLGYHLAGLWAGQNPMPNDQQRNSEKVVLISDLLYRFVHESVLDNDQDLEFIKTFLTVYQKFITFDDLWNKYYKQDFECNLRARQQVINFATKSSKVSYLQEYCASILEIFTADLPGKFVDRSEFRMKSSKGLNRSSSTRISSNSKLLDQSITHNSSLMSMLAAFVFSILPDRGNLVESIEEFLLISNSNTHAHNFLSISTGGLGGKKSINQQYIKSFAIAQKSVESIISSGYIPIFPDTDSAKYLNYKHFARLVTLIEIVMFNYIDPRDLLNYLWKPNRHKRKNNKMKKKTRSQSNQSTPKSSVSDKIYSENENTNTSDFTKRFNPVGGDLEHSNNSSISNKSISSKSNINSDHGTEKNDQEYLDQRIVTGSGLMSDLDPEDSNSSDDESIFEDGKPPNEVSTLLPSIEFTNFISEFIIKSILSLETPSLRALMIENFAKVALELEVSKNLNSLGAVLAGLNSAAIGRLSKTKSIFNQSRLASRLAKSEDIMASRFMYQKYRMLCSELFPHYIPFLPVLLGDLVHYNESSKDILSIKPTIHTIGYYQRRQVTLEDSLKSSSNRYESPNSPGSPKHKNKPRERELVGINWLKFENMGRLVLNFAELQERNPISSINSSANGSISFGVNSFSISAGQSSGNNLNSSSIKNKPVNSNIHQMAVLNGVSNIMSPVNSSFNFCNLFGEFDLSFLIKFLGQNLLDSDEQYDLSLILEPRVNSLNYSTL